MMRMGITEPWLGRNTQETNTPVRTPLQEHTDRKTPDQPDDVFSGR